MLPGLRQPVMFKDLVVLISEFELWPVSFSWRPQGKFSNGGASSTRTEGTWLDFRSGISAFMPGLVKKKDKMETA